MPGPCEVLPSGGRARRWVWRRSLRYGVLSVSSLRYRVSDLREEGQLAKTLSPMRVWVTGILYSRAEMAIHLPVPLRPAESQIFSRRRLPSSSLNFRIAMEILIRKDSSSPLFH